MGLLNALNVPFTAAPVIPAASSTAADKVSTRITPVAVAAPVANQNISDNKSAPPVLLKSQKAASTAVAVTTSQDDAVEISPSLMSESSAVQSALFGRFMPAPTYNTLLGYGFVKYKPSDAGLDQPAVADGPPRSTSGSDTAPQPAAQAEYKAYSNTQVSNQKSTSVENVIA